MSKNHMPNNIVSCTTYLTEEIHIAKQIANTALQQHVQNDVSYHDLVAMVLKRPKLSSLLNEYKNLPFGSGSLHITVPQHWSSFGGTYSHPGDKEYTGQASS